MRFLVDECLTVRLTQLLIADGHDALHVLDDGLQGRPDDVIMGEARSNHRILLTSDTDSESCYGAAVIASPVFCFCADTQGL